MREISYRLFCSAGALTNPRLFTRSKTNSRGERIGTAYYDSGHGVLVHPGPCMKGPPT